MQQDVAAGVTVECTVKSLNDSGAVMAITKHITGFVPAMHFADVALRKPERKFFPGAKIRCRVLDNSVSTSGRRKLSLTCKQTLVDSDLPIITSLADAPRGAITHAFVCAVKPYGCIVRLYNHVRGLVPRKELSTSGAATDPAQFFKVGQVVKCRVLEREV